MGFPKNEQQLGGPSSKASKAFEGIEGGPLLFGPQLQKTRQAPFLSFPQLGKDAGLQGFLQALGYEGGGGHFRLLTFSKTFS